MKGLRRARKAAGLTQEALAEKTGINRVTITRYELGERDHPSTDNLKALAAALGVTVDELLRDDQPPATEATPQPAEAPEVEA